MSDKLKDHEVSQAETRFRHAPMRLPFFVAQLRLLAIPYSFFSIPRKKREKNRTPNFFKDKDVAVVTELSYQFSLPYISFLIGFLMLWRSTEYLTVWRNAEWIAVMVACKTPKKMAGESDGKTGQTRAYLGVSSYISTHYYLKRKNFLFVSPLKAKLSRTELWILAY